MDVNVKYSLGLLFLFGFLLNIYAQECTEIPNCKTCGELGGVLSCLECDENFAQYNQKCCSKGCNTDFEGKHACDLDRGGICLFDSCLNTYYGDYCQPCSERIQNCDDCDLLKDTEVVQCTHCVSDFYLTANGQQCCPQGCASCIGTDGRTCTSCKQSYFLYNNSCDTCGNNCIPPTDGSARCDPDTGACYLGCRDGWHGRRCNVQCNLDNCVKCNYNEAADLLTCSDCIDGRYGINCDLCSANCAPSPQGNADICYQDGSCKHGCNKGYQGARCDVRCDRPIDMANCTVCERYSFLCTECKPGHWGQKCQYSCDSNCVGFQGNRLCAIADGTCDLGCLAGHYKANCSGSCPNCGQDVCNRDTGNCLDLICDPGFYGPACNSTCPVNCAPNPVTGNAYCDFTNGSCEYGCGDGYWGTFCNRGCSIHCAQSPSAVGTVTRPPCIQETGTCRYDCTPGYFGHDCLKNCISQCVDGTCDINSGQCEECNKGELAGPQCPFGTCPVGKYGQFCQVNCTERCRSACGRYNGTCFGCDPGFHGNNCEFLCGVCSSGSCDQKTGLCTTDCRNGFWNVYCNETCLYDGCETCFKGNGRCDICKVGFHGTNCDRTCSVYCARNSLDQVICVKETAACDEGKCLPGYWNRPCDITCNSNCRANANGERPCSLTNGACDLGCEDTYYGQQCNSRCSVYCIDRLCERDGRCALGCIDGRYGEMCELACRETCNNGQCNRTHGECEECNKPYQLQTELCRTAACSPINTWGVFCENDCPQNCADGTCSRKDGTCSSCVSERYGAKCDQACPNCKSNMCYQTDGACMDGGCDDGWYTLQCMTECKHEGCKDCDRTNGECITCKDGKYGLNCTLDCQRNCAPNAAGSITCNRFSGECDVEACKVGYYGRKCDLTCSEFCLNVACDIDEGTCELCRQGWYGQRCDGQCSPRCRNNDCEVTEDNCRQGCTDGYWGGSCEKTCNANCNLKACNQQSGECLYGCVGNNYYQLACSEPCSTNCVENVCNRTGYCMRGCKTGWYGDKCQFQCQAATKCTDGTCSRIGGVCEDCFDSNPGPNCPTADCPSGLKGAACEDLCNSTNCQFNRCERYTGACIACPLGYYGSLCDKTCFRCREGSGCDQTTGICDAGCEDGWYRPDCETKCSDVCGSCERNSGECVTCAPGRWGIACELLCSTNCNATNVGGIHLVFCEKATGACLEKACKVGYWGTDCTQVCSTNCLQDSNNNRVCSYEEGKCLIGCKSTFYGDQCDSLCSPRCRDQLCTNFRDSCNLNCADGYYGATCSGTCSPHCAGQGRCNPDNGTCFEGCEIGYYGPRCLPCKNTCLDGTCDTTGGCPDCLDPIGPQCRVQVCPTGLYGTTCESNCPGDYCQNNQCHRHKGTCENGCLEKYYGAYCTERCQCYEPGIISCNHTNGECICKPGRYGTKCDQTCSPGCSGNECDRTGTCTLGCLKGRYGAKCDESCTNCLSEACGAETGICLQGCVDGWYGPQCKNPCPVECKKCDIESGKCTTCADEYFPLDLCDKTCSSNCVRVGTSRVCSQANGECLNGCKLGYYGPDCSQTCGQCNSCNSNDGSCQVCNPGWWGTTCKSQCNSHCSRGGSSNERICRQSDGYCEFGCDPGFYGDTCSSSCTGINCAGGICNRQLGTCKEGCVAYFYGENCDDRCDSCKAGVCDQVNGNCIGDCPASFYGNKCDKECKTPICNDAICNKDSGFCEDCQLSPKGPRCSVQDAVTANPITQMEADDEVLSIGAIIGITVGSVCFVIIFVIVFVCCMNYKRRYDDAKTEIHLPSDVIERLSTHRSLHSTVSTNYPVARVVGDDEKDFVLF